jgi:hypothetical protein
MLDEEESVILLTLVDKWILGVEQHQLEGLDEEVDEGEVLVEQRTLVSYFLENQLDDLVPQRWRETAIEVLELLLTVLGLLGIL